MKKTANNTFTATVNGIVFTDLTMEQAQALISFASANAESESKPESKPESKTRKQRKQEKHESAKRFINIKKCIMRDVNAACKRASEKCNVTLEVAREESYCITAKGLCTWGWLVSPDGTLNKKNGRKVAAALPKKRITDDKGNSKLVQVWKYSSKRNAIFRDFGEDIRA